MRTEFHKYHGNGNDFILIDNRQGVVSNLSQPVIEKLCHRRFGIGADGLILMNTGDGFDFEMKYYNSDGNESTMCGNGGRCIVKFASELGLIKDRTRFLAIDGPHEGVIRKDGSIMLKMKDVNSFDRSGNDYIINTGSPHFVRFVADVSQLNVHQEGREIRNRMEFVKEGINVNFVEQNQESLTVRTYERGVEDETLSCGTGIVASALVTSIDAGKKEGRHSVSLVSPGGTFEVTFLKTNNGAFSDIWLIGAATFVFKGEAEW